MVYFDKNTLSVLRFLYRRGDRGATWGEIRAKFGDFANAFLMAALSDEEYIVIQDDFGNWLFPDKELSIKNCENYRSFLSSRGRELLERRLFDFWKWVIPTLISVSALIVSVLSAISSCR